MELQEQVNSLTQERNQYAELFKNADAERAALNQICQEQINANLTLRKDLVLKSGLISELTQRVKELSEENNSLKAVAATTTL